MENDDSKLSNDKKLLYEFLDSYPQTTKNNTTDITNNSIDTLINFMHFMNSKNKNKSNKQENDIKIDSKINIEKKVKISYSTDEVNNYNGDESNENNNYDNEPNEIINENNIAQENTIPNKEEDFQNVYNKLDVKTKINKEGKAKDYYKNIIKENNNENSNITNDNNFKNISQNKKKKDANKNKNNLFQNYKYQAVLDEANQILQNKYKANNENKNNYSNIILPDVLYPDMIIEKLNERDKKADEETYKEKVYELNKERVKNKNESEKIKKLKINYDNLYSKLQNEISKFNSENFNKYKKDEKEKLEKEKKQLILEQKEIGELRIKYQMNNKLNNKKDKEDIIQLKKMFQKFQEENKSKESNNKILIDKYKRQLDEANNQILLLNAEITKLQSLQNNEEDENYNFNNKDTKDNNIESPRFYDKNKNLKNEIKENKTKDENQINLENEIEENYDLIFPDKYHKEKYKLINIAKTEDGKKINFYDKNKKEIIFQSGVRKEIYYDGYQIIFFTNGDIKQIFPDKKKQVYFFNESKIIQTTIPDNLNFRMDKLKNII